jgi:hypothetical protein
MGASVVSLPLAAVLRKRAIAIGAGLMFVVPPASFIAAGALSELQREASITRAKTIIDGADHFRARTGRYPTSSAELVPDYLPAMPRTKMGLLGSDYYYATRGDGYSLSFELPAWMVCHYDSRTRAWTISD